MSANSLVNKAVKKLLQKMNEPEFYETFNNMSIKELSIPGFNQKKSIANIPKSILITSIFKPSSLQFDALGFLYNHYKISGAYRNRKFDKYKDPQEVIADLNGENYNQMLIWLLSNENEDFKKTGCDFIHSDLFDQLIQEKSQQPGDADILPQPLAQEQESLIHTADILKKENETLKNKLKKMEVKNAALAKSLQATKDSAAEVNTKLKKAEVRLSTLCDEHQRQAQEIALINQKYDSLMNDYEILYEKYDAEISCKKVVTETPVKASRIVVITNQSYENAELPALVETCQQEQIDTIIEQWGLISAIYVSECCISDGNRRKLMKKKKTDDLTIRFLNESRIEEVIYGGKNDGFHKN